jgi:hypothetical protein
MERERPTVRLANYRPISLTIVARKIFEMSILQQTLAEIGQVNIAQGVSRTKRGPNQCFALDTATRSAVIL